MKRRVYCSISLCVSAVALVAILAGICIATPAADLGRAKDLIAADDYASAVPLLSPIASTDSAIGLEALVLLGDCHRELREPSKALSSYQRALKSPQISETLRRAAKERLPDCYLGLRDWDSALSVCNQLLTEYPESTTYWSYLISQCLASQGKTSEASIILDSALSAASTADDLEMVKRVKAKQAYHAIVGRDWTAALTIYQDLILQFPEDTADWQYRIGLCYKGLNKMDQALSVFQDLAARGPESTAGRQSELRVAECLYLQGQHDAALAMLDRYVLNSPHNHPQALLAKAEFLARIAKAGQKSIDVCDELAARYPDIRFGQDAIRLKAMVTLADLKQPEEAKAIYDRLIADNPHSGLLGEWYFYRAMCSYSEGDWATARDGFHEMYCSIPVGKWQAEAKFFEGDCCLQLKDASGAAAAFQEVVDSFGGSTWAKSASDRLAAIREARSAG